MKSKDPLNRISSKYKQRGLSTFQKSAFKEIHCNTRGAKHFRICIDKVKHTSWFSNNNDNHNDNDYNDNNNYDDDDDNDDDDNDDNDDDENNNEEDVEDTEEESRETSNEEYLDFAYEANNFVRKKDKEFLKNKVQKMKTFYRCFYKKK